MEPGVHLHNDKPESYSQAKPSVFIVDIASMDYVKALQWQHRLVAARKQKRLAADLLILLEHPPVYTLGRRGGKENIKVSTDFLKKKGIAIIQAERGGFVTYHGPGQLVGYPIIDLHAFRLGVDELVTNIEEVMLRTARDWNVAANRDPRNRGVWSAGAKLGSIGIAIRQGISYHGFALNVNPDLQPFNWVEPCGLQNVHMTSMAQVSGRKIDMGAVRKAVSHHFKDVFNIRLQATALNDLRSILQKSSE